MNKVTAALLAIAAFAAAPAFGQEGPRAKECFQRCVDNLPAEKLKKTTYDYEAVNNDATKTEAEKKRSHKRAVAGVCKDMCHKMDD